ncbi:GntR family transcriptional regulator [Zhihengliuella alba]|uniref:GntR family transcriptional regulator n=1 Tax=Zhihengliuella alba TaxID=547018 RepID=A0ABP7DCI4_9MICC
MADRTEFKPESVRVTEQLRNEIVDGARAPGSKLVERDLAEELGVSRLPVREALQSLVAEGLVTPRPRSWAIVREFTASDIADLIEVRAALEVLTFRLAAQRRTRAALEDLKQALEEELAAAKAGEAVAARRAGVRFHEIVTRMAGNDLLLEVQGSLSARMRWLLSQHHDLEGIAAEHAELYDALARRDASVMEALVLQHLETSRINAAEATGQRLA